ncbi:MAG TPA: hypothetical protein VKU36_05440 [Candidatus Babeliales bacterium]|nr:hypothetical protein [Candidatus Babeliales bacterium]
MKHKIMYIIASLLLTNAYITAMQSPLTNSQDDIRLALESLKDDNNLKKSSEIHQPLTTTPETPRKKSETHSITGYYIDTSKGEILPNNVPIYNALSRKNLYEGSLKNYKIEHFTFNDKDNKERKIVAEIKDKYDGQTHLVIADSSPNQDEPYIINLQQLQKIESQQLQKDAIRYPNIRFHRKRPDLSTKNPILSVKKFKIQYGKESYYTYYVEYIDKDNNLQQISIPSSSGYKNESFAIIKNGKKEFIFLQLKTEEIASTQSTQPSIDSTPLTGTFSNNPSSELISYRFSHLESMGSNRYKITYMANGSEKEIIVTATKTYENQKHLIVAGNDEQNAFVIDLQDKETATNLEDKPVASQITTPTEIEIKEQEETTQALDIFKEILEEERKQKLQTSSSSCESSPFRDIEDMVKEQENKQQEKQKELEKIENPKQKLQTSSSSSQDSAKEQFKQLQNQLIAEQKERELEQQQLENLKKLKKEISDNRKRRTYIVGAATLTALLGLILYLYKNNKLPDILSQLPDVVSNSFKKYMPTN